MPSTRRLMPVAAALAAFAAILPSAAYAAPARPRQPQSAQAAAPADQGPLSRDWKRLQLPNFTIVGTVSPKDLVRLAADLDVFCDVLAQTQPALTLTSPVPTYVVALKSLDERGGFRPRDDAGGRPRASTQGYFTAGPDGNYMVLPWRGSDQQALTVLQHEFSHYVLSRNFAVVPLWLHEGFSMLYMTVRADAARGMTIIGEPPRERVRILSERRLMPLERLLTLDTVPDRPEERWLFYAQSWALVHFLLLGQENAPPNQIVTYLEAINSGQSRDSAFQRAFGGTYEAFGWKVSRYANGQSYPYSGVKPSGKVDAAPAVSQVEPMTEADAASLQAGLFLRIGAVPEAEAALALARTSQPPGLRTRMVADRIRWSAGRVDDEDARFEEFAAVAAQAEAAAPRDTSVSFHRSLAALAAGRQAEAEAALKTTLLRNHDPEVHRVHANVAFIVGNDAAAARHAGAYLDSAGSYAGSSVYTAILGALALRRLQQRDEAARMLERAGPGVRPGTWTAKVLDCVRGALPAAALLASARDSGEQTEAHTYIGFEDALAGRREAALTHFRWVKDRGSRNFAEYPMAVAELKRLEAVEAK